MNMEDTALKNDCISVTPDHVRHLDIEKFIKTPDGRKRFLELMEKINDR